MPPFARLRDVVPSAYLRVFQPLDGFERQEQLHWERYLVEGARTASLRRAVRRPRDHRRVGRAGARGGRARRGPGDRRTDVRQPVAACACGSSAALLSFSATKPIELSDRFVPKQDAKRAAKELAQAPPSRPARGGVRAPEPVARADPVVRAVRRRGALARRGRVRPDPAALPHHGASRDAPCGARRPGPSPVRPRSDLRADPGPAPVDGRVRPGVAAGARLRDALRLHDLGRAGRRPQRRAICTKRSTRSSAKSSRGRRTSTRAC